MSMKISPLDREILEVITELTKALRCCRQDEVFCEDVTFTQFIILDAIAKNKSMNMAELHDVLFVDKSTTTRLVAPLIKKDLVTRKKADHDSRAATLELTGQGNTVHKKVWECLISFIRSVQAQIPHEKTEGVLEGVRIFMSAMQNVAAIRCEDGAGASCECSVVSKTIKIKG